ncbi:colicin immunity protein [Curvibacter sp. APW13]|uniref:colicin immunity protein n=1 Tax=Curvibacter sp. APW13 TaxID=3077236 RepID=UPI0028DD8E1D|nr:colicin immunity protein [Curvibacter sp. APW13]MDT8990967.1 colicin immunity protein [Curvibacter sp. APW13]
MDRTKLYDFADDFFTLDGSSIMKLTPDAAVEVCRRAADRGLVITRVEGGINTADRFEARLDCIWDAGYPPNPDEGAHPINRKAMDFIRAEMGFHNAFILGAVSVSEWK